MSKESNKLPSSSPRLVRMAAKNNKKSEKGSGDKQPSQQQPAKAQKKVTLIGYFDSSLIRQNNGDLCD